MKNSSANGFSLLSPFYDALTKIFFGKNIQRSQTAFIEKISSAKKILILGGGTGFILEKILENFSPEKILYVDISEGMIEKSKTRIGKKFSSLKIDERKNAASPRFHGNDKYCTLLVEGRTSLEFITGTIENISSKEKFDIVITQYFLDLFSDEIAYNVIKKISFHLEKNSFWLYADFRVVKEKFFLRIFSSALIRIMYMLFRLCCGIEAKKLPEVERNFSELGFEKTEEKFFFGGMIAARLYRC